MAIVVPIVADTSGFTRGLTKGSSGIAKFGKVAALAAGAAGVGALVATVKVGIGEFMQQEKVIAQTNAVLKSTKGVANVTAKEIGKLSESLMKKSGIDDEAIQSGQNLLLTFTKVRNEAGKGNDIFNQATVLMTDLSVAMGKDLNSSAMLVGKALNDPIKGVSALSRAGVQFTKEQKETIKTMVESGNVMGAQKMILKELETQFGGSAEAAGKTLGGQLNILKETFNNMAGDLVARFMPTVARAAQAVVDFVKKFADAPTLRAKVDVIFGGIRDITGRLFKDLWTWWNTTQQTDLPARVIITPSGKQQFLNFYEDLKEGFRNAGRSSGKALANALFSAFSQEGLDRAGKIGESVTKKFMTAFNAVFSGHMLAVQFLDGFFQGFIPELASRLRDALTRAVLDAIPSVTTAGDKLRKKLFQALARSGKSPQLTQAMADRLTTSIREAIPAARASLVSGGASVASMLADIVNVRTPWRGQASGQMLKDQRDLEDRRLNIEEQRLKDALDAAEDKTEAQLALDEFYFQKDATLRQRSIDDANADNTRKITDLVDSFNKGLISAEDFRAQLNGIIGGGPGDELGSAFATAFDSQLQTVLSTAQEISQLIAEALGVTKTTDLEAALSVVKASNDQRYKEYLSRWNALKQRREDAIDDLEDIIDDPKASADDKKAARKQIAALRGKIATMNQNKRSRGSFGLALGGILNKQVFTAGEAGPEAVMPLTGRGGVMLRDALGLNGSQGSTYNITVNAGMGTSGIDLGREIVAAIKQYERTNGNVFAGA